MFATLVRTGSELSCKVIHPPKTRGEFIYRLTKFSREVDRSPLTPQPVFSWKMDNPLLMSGGVFHVLVEYHDSSGESLSVETECQYVPSSDSTKHYTEWLENDSPAPLPLAPLPSTGSLPPPFHAIVYISVRQGQHGSTAGLRSLAATTGSSLYKRTDDNSFPWAESFTDSLSQNDSFLLTSSPLRQLTPTIWAAGSGTAFLSDALACGDEVAQALQPLEDQSRNMAYTCDTCGEFLVAAFAPSHTEFHSDYFGGSAWYEYSDESIHIVASSFLLAVRAALSLGIQLSLDPHVIDCDFTSLTQPFQQPILNDLELRGFSVLSPNVCLIAKRDGSALYEDSQYGVDIANPPAFTSAEYEILLEQAKNELIRHCNSILAFPGIDTVVCDISGGLDSRLVLAGFLQQQQPPAKLRIRTQPALHAPSRHDEAIALLVAQACGVPFDDEPWVTVGPCTARHSIAKLVAATFGVYWLRSPGPIVQCSRSVSVGGNLLDNIARDYTTQAWSIQTQPVDEPDEVALHLAQQLFRWRGRATMKPTPLRGIVQGAMNFDKLPGDERAKAARLFDFHRARFHGAAITQGWFGVYRLNPGPTRSLFLLRLMASDVLAPHHVQLELLHRLNPGLAAVPFDSEAYNSSYRRIFGAQRSDLQPDMNTLAAARKRSREHSRQIPCSA